MNNLNKTNKLLAVPAPSVKTYIVLCCISLAALPMTAIADTSESIQVGPRTLTEDQNAAISIELRVVSVYSKVSKAAFDDGDYAVAERAARNGLAVMPSDLGLLKLQGEALIHLELYKEALLVFTQVNEAMRDRDSFARMGLLNARLGQHQVSSQMAGQGLLEDVMPKSLIDFAVSPNNARNLEAYWLLSLGLIAEMHANNSESIYYYSQAQKLLPSHVVANTRLGKIYMEQKNYEKSAEYYGRVKTGPKKTVFEAKQQLMIARDKAKKTANAGGGS